MGHGDVSSVAGVGAGTWAILALLLALLGRPPFMGRQRGREPGRAELCSPGVAVVGLIRSPERPFRNSPRTGEMGTQATPHGPRGAIHAGASPAPPDPQPGPSTPSLSLRWEGRAWKMAQSQIFLFEAAYSMGVFKCPVFKGTDLLELSQ